MKNLLLVFAMLFSLSVSAQKERAGFTFSAAAGLLPTYLKDQAYQNQWPAAISVGYRFKGILALQVYGGRSIATSGFETLADETQVRYLNNTTIIGLKAALHSTRFERIDVYGGSMLALYRSDIRQLNLDGTATELPKSNGPSPTKPYKYRHPKDRILITAFVGASYYANRRLSIFIEAGWGISVLQAGFRLTAKAGKPPSS